jgi:hypothetical protein
MLLHVLVVLVVVFKFFKLPITITLYEYTTVYQPINGL